ncbi:hypothetical protein ACHAQJ_001214 [Trichoderma viride]
MTGQDDTSRIQHVESRLARIEELLEQVLATTTTVSATTIQSPAAPPTISGEPIADLEYPAMSDEDVDQILSRAYLNIAQLVGPSVSEAPTSNITGASFTRMLHSYFASTCQQNPRAVWAAINIVLALGTRLPVSPSADLDLGSRDGQVAKYINNVQSVLAELIARDVNLLSLQVVLGLVTIFHGLKDSQPSVVLIGTAVRLAHRLRLHSRDYQQHISPNEALERSRVFWIAYLFDKDICLRHHTPSVQVDADIDLDLPVERPFDGSGNVYTKDGGDRVLTNFFQLRLRLAHIQGRVYDQLFSTRAAKIRPQERQARVTLLHNELERWRLTVPSELQADVVTEYASRTALFWLCMMHFSYLGCLVMIHGMWSHDVEWRQRLTATSAVRGVAAQAADRSRMRPPLPRGWKHCVQMSRHCMALMYQMPLSDCSVWANGCAYFSALIILQSNLFENPLHDEVNTDLHLTSYAVSLFDRMSETSTILQMKRLNVVAAELDRRARLVIGNARQTATDRSPSSERIGTSASIAGKLQLLETDLDSLVGLQWDWGNDGVEAWPSMDVSLKENYDTVPFRPEAPEADFGPFTDWMEVGGFSGTTPFGESVTNRTLDNYM